MSEREISSIADEIILGLRTYGVAVQLSEPVEFMLKENSFSIRFTGISDLGPVFEICDASHIPIEDIESIKTLVQRRIMGIYRM